MKNLSYNYKVILLVFGVVILCGIACQKKVDPGATSAVKVANSWWCHLLDASGNELVPYAAFFTYNTASNKDSVWVDDNDNFDNFKAKAQFKSDGSFAATNSPNEYYSAANGAPETVTISDGKVLPKAGRSKTGLVVDSIYMKITFSNDPDTYIIAGTAQTGWDGDAY